MKIIQTGILACLLTFVLMPSAQAWVCYMHNARGQHFDGFGFTRGDAAAHVMGKCSRNSEYARNCQLDSCHP